MNATRYCRMQAETVRVDAARLLGAGRPAEDGLQAQHFLPGAWPQRNAVCAGGRLQGRERAIGLGLGQVYSAPGRFSVVICGGVPWASPSASKKNAFTPMSKRRRGFPSETRVKRGYRV